MIWTPTNPNPVALEKVTDKFPIPTSCPYCKDGGEVICTKNSYIYRGTEYGKYPWVYVCTKCRAAVGLHNETNLPLGTLANDALRDARNKAKNLFNPLWMNGEMARSYAYIWLAKKMKIAPAVCHFGLFDEAQCKQAVEIILTRHDTPKEERPDWKNELSKVMAKGKPKFQFFKNAKKLK